MSFIRPSAVPIAVGDREIGFAVPAPRGGFRFVAADPEFGVLDGSRFARLDQLERAASTLARVVGGGRDRPPATALPARAR